MNPVQLLVALCGAATALAFPAEAKTLRLTCTDAATHAKYEIAYDDMRNTITTTHKDFNKALQVEKTQKDDDGLLVWGVMPLGPATKNILVQFGKEKWATHFWGYDDKRKDSCI